LLDEPACPVGSLLQGESHCMVSMLVLLEKVHGTFPIFLKLFADWDLPKVQNHCTMSRLLYRT
jgi:hypothetical protein